MNSSLIGKIEKGILYAEEKDRVRFNNFSLDFRGDNSNHQVTFDNGALRCNCEFFHQAHMCSHTMAIERMLGQMVEARNAA